MKSAAPRSRQRQQAGQVSIMAATMLVALLASAGLAIDLGRMFVVKAQLAKAVDGGALAGARLLPIGNDAASNAALSFARMNFAVGYLGTTSSNFGVAFVQTADDNLIQVTGSATLPTTLMQIAGLNQVTVNAFAEATRRPFQIALVLDTSGSLHPNWAGVDAIGALRTAATEFVQFFDDTMDRMALVRFASGRVVPFALGKNFKEPITAAIAGFVAAGGTTPGSALMEGRDQVSGGGDTGAFKAMVFFTDGRPTSLRDAFEIGGNVVDGVIGGYQDPNTNGGNPPKNLYDPLQVFAKLPYDSPDQLPDGQPATNAVILQESWTRALDEGNTARAQGITIFSIGLGNPNAGPLAQPDPLLLIAIANVQSAPDPINAGSTIVNPYYNSSQPEGAFYFAPDASQLEAVFKQVAQEIVVRLTQ